MWAIASYEAAMRATLSTVSLLLLALCAACGSPDGNQDDSTSESADALTALPRGHFAIDRAPSSGSYVADLTIKAGKKFELEYVRRSTRQAPWMWNPWLTVPVSEDESMLLRGTYFTYAGERGATMISFDFSEGALDHVSYALEVQGDTLRLEGIGQPAFELVRSETSPPAAHASDDRVVSCKGRNWDATFAFEDAGRRRATMKVKRRAASGVTGHQPPNGNVAVVYTGNTGVDDYMAFEGTDAAGGRYELAFKRSELERTSGSTSQLGLGYSFPGSSYFMHNTLACSIAAP